jgi:iron complex transport system ATP-binding protein
MDNLINIENLNIGYKNPLTTDINLSAGKGELICIVGKNGIGKSTLLNTLAGIISPLSGKIYYNSTNFSSLSISKRSQLISYVPSKMGYLSNLNVYELVSMGRSPFTNIFDKKTSEDLNIINDSISSFGLEHLVDKPLYAISDGERQRAMICRAFAQRTPIIFLDEPSAFLDYPSKHKLMKDLSALSKENEKTIIFSSHDLDISLLYCSRVWLFQDKTIESHLVENLKTNKLLKDIMDFNFSNLLTI